MATLPRPAEPARSPSLELLEPPPFPAKPKRLLDVSDVAEWRSSGLDPKKQPDRSDGTALPPPCDTVSQITTSAAWFHAVEIQAALSPASSIT
jgi:hypothetical protein